MSKWENMKESAQNDLGALKRAETSYGDSWKRRGGVGAFMMLARKFDRIEHQAQKHGWDIFEAGEIYKGCLLYTSPSPRDGLLSRMPSSA